MFTAIASIFTAFAYRLRGGGWFPLSDWEYRLIWGAVLTLAALFLGANYLYAIALIPLAYAFMLVPHAYCMNIGRWPSPQKKWPSFYLPTLTDAQWAALPQWTRAGYDVVSMASVGFIRGMIAFAPTVVFYSVINALLAAVTIGVLQAAAYFVGWYVPFTVTSSLTKHSTEWGEFFTGASWALALAVLLA